MGFSADWTQNGYNPAAHGFWKADTGEGNFGYPQNYYFADTLRAVQIAFGNAFKDIYVIRYDEYGYPRKRIQVPIKFGPRAKSHDFRTELETSEIDEDGIVDPKYVVQQPNIAWKMTSLSYDGSRQTSTNQIRTFYDEYLTKQGVEYHTLDLLWQDTMPIPVNIGIEMQINTDKDSDAHQIIENVINRTENGVLYAHVKEFWFINLRRDYKIILNSCNWQVDSDSIGEDAKREVKPTFTFTVQAFFYRPISNGDIITQIITTLNPHINYGTIERYGISGNMYMNEKYKDASAYSAVLNNRYEGSLISSYDFTNKGYTYIGPESALDHTEYVDMSGNPITISGKAYSAEDYYEPTYMNYRELFYYKAIPDTLIEYPRYFKMISAIDYSFEPNGYFEDETGIIRQAYDLNTTTSYYTIESLKQNNYLYGTKDLMNSKHKIIDAVYGTSVSQSSLDINS